MQRIEEPTEVHLNWNAILILVSALLLSTGMWGAAIGALIVLLR
jgi:hypothetical protein